MSKSLYELLLLIDASEEARELANVSRRQERKKYYLNLQKEILDLIQCATLHIDISIGNPVEFYNNIASYFKKKKKEEIIPLEKLILNEDFAEKIIKKCQDFDELLSNNTEKKNYAKEVLKNPLFIRIVGERAEEDKEELERKIEAKINIKTVGKDVYDLTNTSDDWKNKIELLRKKEKITEAKYNKYMIQINYLISYYFSCKKGEQEKLVKRIKEK